MVLVEGPCLDDAGLGRGLLKDIFFEELGLQVKALFELLGVLGIGVEVLEQGKLLQDVVLVV